MEQSILVFYREIAWTEEPGHLQSIELQKELDTIEHADWTTSPNPIVFDVLLHT